MGGGASGMGGVEHLLQTTIMIGKAIAGISFPGMYRIYDFHSELAPPLRTQPILFFGFPDEDNQDEDDDEVKARQNIDKAQYEHLFHVTVGEDEIYIEEPLCVNEAGWTPLHTCCMSVQTIPAALKLIDENIKRDGNLDIKTKHGPGTFNAGWTCLHIATAYGIQPIVERLVKAGANVNTTNSFGYSPLLEACHRGFTSIAKILIEHGASLSYMPSSEEWAKSPFISSPCQAALGEASRGGFLEIVETLLEAGAEVDQTNFLGWSALHEACFYNRTDVVKKLLIHGANAALRTNKGALPYHLSSLSAIKEILTELGGQGTVPAEHDQINMLEVLAEISVPKAGFIITTGYSDDGNDPTIPNKSPSTQRESEIDGQPRGERDSIIASRLGNLPEMDRRSSNNESKEDKKKHKKKKKAHEDVPPDMPKEFLCELTRKPMNDPVKSIYGNIFEKATIMTWFKNQGRICPLSGLPLCETDVTPDEELRKAIKKWILQKSMEQNNEEPSLEAAPKVRSKPIGSATKAVVEADDDLYDF